VHCSQVFRSSVPSDLLPSSPAGAGQAPFRMNAAALDQGNGGSAPVAECHIEGAVRQSFARRRIREDTVPGPVRSQGRVARCVIQNWSHVLSAPRRAWNRHGTMARVAWTRGRAGAAPLQSGPFQQVKLAEPAHKGTGEYQSSALLGAPVVHGRGRQSPDQARGYGRRTGRLDLG
jgi:hypothetical protein